MNDIIYMDLECVLPKHDSCSNGINKSSAEDVDTHQVCGYSSTIVKDRSKEKITTFYRGEDILSKLCKELHEKALELINTEKKELIPLTPDQEKEHNECKRCHILIRHSFTIKIVHITRIIKKSSIMIITQVYIEVQDIAYVT